MRTKRITSLVAAVAVAAVALLGCSSDDKDEATDDDKTESTTSTTTPDAKSAPVKVDATDLGAEARVTVEPGARIEITTDGVTEVSSSDEQTVKPIQPGEDEDLGDKPGAEALIAGDAVLKLFDKDGKELYEVEVFVE